MTRPRSSLISLVGGGGVATLDAVVHRAGAGAAVFVGGSRADETV